MFEARPHRENSLAIRTRLLALFVMVSASVIAVGCRAADESHTLSSTPDAGRGALLKSEIEQGKHLYTATEKPIFLSEAEVGDAKGTGILFPISALKVINRRAEALNVRITGWRELGADRVIYEQMGHRILTAALTPKAAENIVVGAPVVDPNTDITWFPVSMDIWIDPEDLNTDRALLWDNGNALFETACVTCHSSMKSHHYLSNQWIGTLNSMKHYLSLEKHEYRFLQKYLQLHAKDTIGQRTGGRDHAE